MSGSAYIAVEYKSQKKKLRLLVAAGSDPPLMGRDWLIDALQLDWRNLMTNQLPSQKSHIEKKSWRSIPKYIFKDELGLVKDTAAKIYIDL